MVHFTCDIIPNGVLSNFITPPLPPHSVHDFMELLDLAFVPSHLSHLLEQGISISFCPPKIAVQQWRICNQAYQQCSLKAVG